MSIGYKPPLDDAVVTDVSAVFAALGEPTRLRIVEQLRRGPLFVSELVEGMKAKQANVSKQLGILHRAGLVGRERHGLQVRYFIAEPFVLQLCDAVCAKIDRDAQSMLDALKRRRSIAPTNQRRKRRG